MARRRRARRLRTKHGYHDAEICAVKVESEATLFLEVKLCGCSDLPGTVHLIFSGVRNLDEVLAALEPTAKQRASGFTGEILSLAHEAHQLFVLYLDTGAVRINAEKFIET